MAQDNRVRGSVWKHNGKKKGWGLSVGAYSKKKGDRHFVLTGLKNGKTRVYESPAAAREAGWELHK